MTALDVDLIIAVHSATRPIARAVGSVVDHNGPGVRVSVVAHNIPVEVIRENLGAYADHPRVRLLELHDGVRSPANPMNHGLDAAEAPFVAVMGSDDELAPGAVDSWLRIQAESGASTIIARIRIAGRGNDPYPPVRNGRRVRDLDARKDRLSYRSAPLGLVDRRRFPALRFTEGLASGEDLAYTSTLWFTGNAIAYDLGGPAYIVNDDADDRVTFSERSVDDDFAFLDAIEAMPWFATLSRAGRTALVVKILRVHFFDAVLGRIRSSAGLLGHREDLCAVLDRAERLAPGVLGLLARVDRDVIDEVRSSAPSDERILSLLDARWNYRTFRALATRNLLLALHRQAPFRTLFAGMRAMSAG